MNIADITTRTGHKPKRTRVGRGRASGKGKTSGRGHKGAGSRAGAHRHGFKEGGQMPTFRRLPKRGFSNALFRREFHIVNIADLERKFENGAHVTPQALVEARLIGNVRLPVKVLGNGALSKNLKVEVAAYSKTAEDKIKSAGGEAIVASRQAQTATLTTD